MSEIQTQAKRVIGKFPGGVDEVAAITELTSNAVYRWDYPPTKGGCGGFIPSKYHRVLLDAARKRGYQLTHADFLGDEEIERSVHTGS